MSDFQYRNLGSCWEETLKSIDRFGGEVEDLVIERAATQDEVQQVESNLGHRLPESFRRMLTGFSKSVEMTWSLPEELELADPFSEIFRGNIHWSLDQLEKLESARQDWIRECFPNPSDPYDRVWHNKLVFYEIENGDFISLDLSATHHGEVVYLSHDDGQGHGVRLAKSFDDFIHSWSMLAGVGGEDWQWLPFYDPQNACLDYSGEHAMKFRKIIGLTLR
ncbi:SMI1/KNR4 family protein [Parasedimentitalea huanghaiensis]|uniref:SMI1/KNR4 family protein n=1 Tax=Parasedimentitalea huanghaiensis TaxID=2682100 RepID=A0A6L6WC59_9RHOB|nr:SMI1/KNR4 family protein [Zongyanglinia huanghaiensis]MVO15284.1 SMI1/KNR4 family protein [Zongyanglinia huanghaiensis]